MKRKRARAAAMAQAGQESPNPKARKQLKTTVTAVTEPHNEHNAPQGTQKTSTTLRRKPASQQQTATTPEDPHVTATPARRPTRSAPKTEKPAARSKVANTARRGGRKSAPGRGRKLPSFELEDAPNEDSEGEDPLLLIGTNTWVPVPWKPLFNEEIGNVAVKTEDQEVDFAATNDANADTENFATDASGPGPSVLGIQPPGPSRKPSSATKRPAFPDFLTQVDDDVSDDDATHTLPLPTAGMDPDSSFSGINLERNEPVREFTVPLRMNSPPPRHRRKSAVSQREETPGLVLEHIETGTSAGGQSRKTELREPTTPPQPPSSRDLGPITRASPGPLKFAPATPTSVLRHHRKISLARPRISMSSPFQRVTTLEDGVPAYPSPRYVGKELGTLSPEKGRGPTRGLLPRLDEDEDELEQQAKKLDLGQGSDEIKEEDQHDNPVPTFAEGLVAQLRPRGGWADAEVESHGEHDEDQHDASLDTHHEETPADEEEEEWENSMRVERELTHDLMDDDLGEDELQQQRDLDESVQHDSQLATLITSSSPVILPGEITPKEEDEDDSIEWDAPKAAQQDQMEEGTSTGPPGLSASPRREQRAMFLREAQGEPVFDETMEESESESDDDGPPVVEITSKDPMVAARAAAILKLVRGPNEHRCIRCF